MTQPTKKARVGMLDIDESIYQPASLDEHLCMYACFINALRTEPLRLAFSANNLDDPAKQFKECAASRFVTKQEKTIFEKRIAREGYNHRDMIFYLEWLKSNGKSITFNNDMY